MKYLKRTTWDISATSATFHHFQYLYCTIFPKQLHTVRKKLPKKQGQKMAPMAPEHLGSMVLLQSWPLPLAQRAHAPGKIHNFQRSEVCWGGCSLNKQCGLSLGWKMLCCFWVCFCMFLSQCSAIYFVGYHISSVTTVISDVWWWLHSSWLENFAAESNRMKQQTIFACRQTFGYNCAELCRWGTFCALRLLAFWQQFFWLRPFHATDCLKEGPQLQVS